MIMVNYDMAEKNGYALVKDIRKKDKDGSVPVICYGRNIPEEAMYTKEKGGIDDWLLPPFPDVDIQNKMRKWIRRMANQRPSEPGDHSCPVSNTVGGMRRILLQCERRQRY